MNAEDLVLKYKEALVGKTVKTIEVGDYPGGNAVVTRISPDPNAPEISFTVRHPTFGEMGVFCDEACHVVD